MSGCDSTWDAVVVGAGVGGSVAAALLARRGWRVLLAEKSVWPREKVCGGCLSASALNALKEIGIGSIIADAPPIDRVAWHLGEKVLELPVPRGAAVMRGVLDAALVEEAQRSGAEFLPECAASLTADSGNDSARVLRLTHKGQTREVRAGLVIAADGIGGTLLAAESWAKWSIGRQSWMGVAATFASGGSDIEPGAVHMHVGNNGYVGMVRMDGAHVHLAAALDPRACRRGGGPGKIVQEILASCQRRNVVGLSRFRGTGALTRTRQNLGGHRVLAVGDACGYVEPFTGEGMAWAAVGAGAMVQMLGDSPAGWRADLPARWRDRYLEIIGRKQRWCRGMRPTMHHLPLASVAMFLGSLMPGLARWMADAVCRPRDTITSRTAMS